MHPFSVVVPLVDSVALSQLAMPVSIHRNPHPIRIAERNCLGLPERRLFGLLLPRHRQCRKFLQKPHNHIRNLGQGHLLAETLARPVTERHKEMPHGLATADLAFIGASVKACATSSCSASHGMGGPGPDQTGPSFRPELGPVLTVPPWITIQRVRGPHDGRPRSDDNGALAVLATSSWKGGVGFGLARVQCDRRVKAESCTTQRH